MGWEHFAGHCYLALDQVSGSASFRVDTTTTTLLASYKLCLVTAELLTQLWFGVGKISFADFFVLLCCTHIGDFVIYSDLSPSRKCGNRQGTPAWPSLENSPGACQRCTILLNAAPSSFFIFIIVKVPNIVFTSHIPRPASTTWASKANCSRCSTADHLVRQGFRFFLLFQCF